MLLLRFCLGFSLFLLVTHFGGSQLPHHKNTQAGDKRFMLWGTEVWPTTNEELRSLHNHLSLQANPSPAEPSDDCHHRQQLTCSLRSPWVRTTIWATPGFLTLRNYEMIKVCCLKLVNLIVICYIRNENWGGGSSFGKKKKREREMK